MRRKIREEEPARPSVRLSRIGKRAVEVAHRCNTDVTALVRVLQGDLDWIVIKAMEKDRVRRYETVTGLAMDLRRYLANEPVRARPPSKLYRMKKFYRRHQTGVLAASIAALAIIVAVIGISVGLMRARSAESEALIEARAANEARQDAEQMARFLIDLFEVSDPDVAQGQPVDARQLLDVGAARIQRELADQPVRRAELMFAIAQIYHRIGSWDESEDLLKEVLALREANLLPDDLRIVSTLRALGDLYASRAEIEKGEAVLTRALETLEVNPNGSRLEEALTLASYGRLLYSGGRLDESVETLQEAIPMIEREVGKEGRELFDPVYTLAGALRDQGRCQEAEPVLERGEKLARSLGRQLSVAMARMLQSRAGCVVIRDPEAAAELTSRSLEIFIRLLGEEHAFVADSFGNLGIVNRRLERFELAEEQLRRSVEISLAVRGENHSHTANVIGELGVLYWQRGKLEAAAAGLERSLRTFEQVLAADHPWTGWNLWALGNVYRDQGRFQEAKTCYLRALAIQEASLPADNPDLAKTRGDYALLQTLGSGRAQGERD